MKRIIMKKLFTFVFAAAALLSAPFRSLAVPRNVAFLASLTPDTDVPMPGTTVTRADQISQQQFDQILSTLRKIKDNISSGDYDFCNTGVQCNSAEEANALIQGFKELFLTDNDFILYYNEHGWKRIYIEPQKNSSGRYVYWLSGEGRGTRGIYAVWKPDVNSNELLRQHDETKKTIDSLIASAPQDAYEKVKYFNDVLAERITYDMDGYLSGNAKHSPYHGLIEGTCVCTGYSEAFFNLCYYSGIHCAVSDCISGYSANGVPDHKISMVNLDGRWKEVDVTWNDANDRLNYDYFMVDMDDGWQNHINGTTLALLPAA